MKRAAILFASVVLMFALIGCESIGFVEKSKHDTVVTENAALRTENASLKEQLELLKKQPRHHYSLHNEGFRTFRFDADTGQTCIQLTTPGDWKRPGIKGQSCDCEDFLAKNPEPNEFMMKVYCGS